MISMGMKTEYVEQGKFSAKKTPQEGVSCGVSKTSGV
jgi:hypothetical protein